MKIKMGRETYNFTEEDIFIDNDACVQCLTRRVRASYGKSYPLLITKKALKELDKSCERVLTERRVGYYYFYFKEVECQNQ